MPALEGEAVGKKRFKAYPIGYFHIDIAEVRTAEGKLHLYVGIDRTSKLAPSAYSGQASPSSAPRPYDLHTILTDNPVLSDCRRQAGEGASSSPTCRVTVTARACPGEGRVERMNRTIKDATVKRYHYDSHAQLRQHLQLFIDAYNHGRRLKTLKGLTPYEYVARIWTEEPNRFKIDPYHHITGPNT